MRNSLVLLVAWLLITAGAAPAQQAATLELTILSAESGQPLEGATLRLPALEVGAVSDAAGRARIRSVPAGEQEVVIEHIGYRTERLSLLLEAGAEVSGEVALLVDPVPIAGVEVSTGARSGKLGMVGYYDRERVGLGTFLDRAAIEKKAGHTSDLERVLRGLPGLKLPQIGSNEYAVASGRGTVPSSIVAGGSAHCFSLIILDGMRLSPPPPPGPPSVAINALINREEVEAIEWYAGPAQVPSEFGGTGTSLRSEQYGPHCGTLVIWSRFGT